MLRFERGDATAPVGHAILFFRSADGGTAACYLVVPPIPLDLTRYMPPMFAGHLPGEALREVQAVPLPPVPEPVGSINYLRRLAEARGDDMIEGGDLPAGDLSRSLAAVSEIARQYLELCQARLRALGLDDPNAPDAEAEPPLSLDVGDLFYDLMGEHERLMELAKLVGQLRYAVDGGDRRLADETIDQMARLARLLPDKYQGDALIEAARRPDATGQKLAELRLERCFKLQAEDYRAVGEIERRVREINA